ncbi:MAG: hypothetical protein ACTSQI_21635 [Candidatus Helarchaeota archaeon]
MDKAEFVEFVIDYLGSKGITVSSSTGEFMEKTRYVNDNLLKEYNENELKNNIRSVLDEAAKRYEERKSTAKRETKLRDIDLKPVVKKRFCSLPPFCKSV